MEHVDSHVRHLGQDGQAKGEAQRAQKPASIGGCPEARSYSCYQERNEANEREHSTLGPDEEELVVDGVKQIGRASCRGREAITSRGGNGCTADITNNTCVAER